MQTFSGIQNGTGQFTPAVTTRATFRQPNAGSLNTAFTSGITRGRVCVFDMKQRGAYTDSTGSARGSIGGTPNYPVTNTANQADGITSNVTVIDNAGTPAPATRCGVAILNQESLAVGQEGEFVVAGGPVQALISGAANAGDRLDLDVSGTGLANAGRFKVAAANGTVYAVMLETIGAAGLAQVMLVTPHQATTAGNA